MLDCTFQQQSSKLDSTRARSKAVEQARLYKATWLTPATRRRPRRRPPAVRPRHPSPCPPVRPSASSRLWR
ncbi:hypothetical protein G6F63_016914 [Rhizopus arrhizus]|uniref:Uncharacterized protein n=1 Tax=Rhizopus delemar TaxID=936053 RepID=A0A9P7C081_9FUNG|nr:hypothetical protein G6F63_016914 [Rhizopus arrhizus]KAG1529863.1 hypothetical protein G6F50_017709 [Rhizopus delemar]